MAVTTRLEVTRYGFTVTCTDCRHCTHHLTRELARADRAQHEVRHHGVPASLSAGAAAVRKANQRARAQVTAG